MCTWGTSRDVTIERRLSVDACIAEAIVELNRQGVYTTGCCCGHGKGPPTASILPSAQDRARALGYVVTVSESGDPWIVLLSRAAVGEADREQARYAAWQLARKEIEEVCFYDKNGQAEKYFAARDALARELAALRAAPPSPARVTEGHEEQGER